MTLADRKTPETDALIASIPSTLDTSGDAARMQEMVDLARRLERERDAALEALELICKTYGQWAGEPGPSLTDTVESARATLRAIEEGKR